MNPFDPTPRDWTEDAPHENGNYLCHCCLCHETFTGHKRRVVCKACWAKDDAEAKRRAEWLHAHDAPKDWVVLTNGEVAAIKADVMHLWSILQSIRALKPRRMGDHWSWEEGLKPDDVFDLCAEALNPLAP